MAVSKVFISAVNKGVEKVNVPQLKGGLLGVKADVANNAVKEAVTETAQKVGDEILAKYNRVITKYNPDGSLTKTILGLNEVTYETIQKSGAKNYKRMTSRGIYEVESDANGLYTRTQYTSPDGRIREKNYVGGKVFRPVSSQDVLELEAKHNATKGRILKHIKECDETSNHKFITNIYKNGNSECLTFKSTGELKSCRLELQDGKSISKNYENNISSFLIYTKNYRHVYSPVSYHKNPETGALSFLKIEKTTDEFGSNVIKASYEFPSGIKGAEMSYAQDAHIGGIFKKGAFESDKLGKVECTPFKCFINGKEIAREELMKMTGKQWTSDYEEMFEALLGKAMEAENVSSEFLPRYKSEWSVM